MCSDLCIIIHIWNMYKPIKAHPARCWARCSPIFRTEQSTKNRHTMTLLPSLHLQCRDENAKFLLHFLVSKHLKDKKKCRSTMSENDVFLIEFESLMCRGRSNFFFDSIMFVLVTNRNWIVAIMFYYQDFIHERVNTNIGN